MKDLSALALEHKIEGQLYKGCDLEKVMTLIGESRHKKFRSENIGPSTSKKKEGVLLMEFLNREVKLRETAFG